MFFLLSYTNMAILLDIKILLAINVYDYFLLIKTSWIADDQFQYSCCFTIEYCNPRVGYPCPYLGTGMKLTGTGRVRVGYGYEHGMDVKIGNLERQISFVKFRFIRNSKIYIVKYCCLVKIIQLFLNNCLGWLSLYYLFQLAPPVVKEFLVKLDGHSRRDGNY